MVTLAAVLQVDYKLKWGDELGDHNSNPGERRGQLGTAADVKSDQIKLYFRSKSYSTS